MRSVQVPTGVDAPPVRQVRPKRPGLFGRWVDLTAPPQALPNDTVARREKVRKAELTSYSILIVLAAVLALTYNGRADPGTLAGVVTILVGVAITWFLNKTGRTAIAAWVLPVLVTLIIASTFLAFPGLRMVAMPTYDLFALPITLIALTANRRVVWIFALCSLAFVVGDFFLQAHGALIVNGVRIDDIAYEEGIFGIYGVIDRHIILIVSIAFIAFIGARSTDTAIGRADRAEEMAAMEHVIAEQKRQLDIGVQQILQTHVRAANGDLNARVPLGQDNVLWQIAASLNNLLSRLQKSGQAEHQLRRTEEELRRLAVAIDDAQAGRQPIWPAMSHTAADLIIERIARGARPPAPRAQLPGEPPPHRLAPGTGPLHSQSLQTSPLGWTGQAPVPPGSAPLTPGRPRPHPSPSNPWFFSPDGQPDGRE